ncbi:protein TASOR 2 isoform X2 [Antennarius striatus]|uniref:protein TASOR 2 isoform X2 n=1 Tax=Antennarius striatus TaxID=241820 RepID=UPI0035AEBDB7
MESGNESTWSKGFFMSVSNDSDVFQSDILSPLKSSYLYEESKQCFRYKSAVLVKNPALENKYNTFRAKKREAGYSEKDLKESFGFLLFDDIHKAEALGQTGVLTGNSTCTTLGDPANGVYISSYSDCLEQNRWYHGKSGYIVIIRLTKGRVKEVLENYTQNFTAPTEGFDCHVSEQLLSVSARSSSFLAFEKTQYYIYELLDDGSNGNAQSPSSACPYAIVSFSYMDTREALLPLQLESAEKKLDCCYLPWKGQLQVGTYLLDIGLRSRKGALIPAELPPVLKVNRAMSIFDLKQLLPRAVFETGFSGEVFLNGLYCSLCELISSEVEQISSLSLLLCEIKEKDIGLTIPLNDGGFLLLLHSSHFFTYDETDSTAVEFLQGMFVFPDSRVVHKGTKFGQRNSNMSSEILQVLPMLSYADGEVERTPISCENLCQVYAEHMQNYTALINPGLTLSLSRNLSIFPDQYDVLDAHKDVYTTPEWTDLAWQSFRSYLSKPTSFELPVSKASEILTAGQEEQIQDLEEDIYICLSSPEEGSASPFIGGSEDQLTMDNCISNAAAQVDSKDVPQTVAPEDLQHEDFIKDNEKSDLTLLNKAAGMQTDVLSNSAADDLSTELIFSITSSERTVADVDLSVTSTEKSTNDDFQLADYSTEKLQTAGVKFLDQEIIGNEKPLKSPDITNHTKARHKKEQRRRSELKKLGVKTCIETPNLQTIKMQLEDDNPEGMKKGYAKKSSLHQQLGNLSNRRTRWMTLQRKKRLFRKISEDKKLATFLLGLEEAEETNSSHKEKCSKNIIQGQQTGPLTKKIEYWGIKPVTSECGRFLIPYGSVDIADCMKTLTSKLQLGQDETCPEKNVIDGFVNDHDTVEMESSIAPKTIPDETEVIPSTEREAHPSEVMFSHVIPEDNILRRSDDGNGSLASNHECNETPLTGDASDTSSLTTDQEKHDTPFPGKFEKKDEFLLTKLKSVLLGEKRKVGILVPEEGSSSVKDIKPCVKKSKLDSNPDSSDCVQDTNLGDAEVSKISVDPHFAHVLGLTRKEIPDRIPESEHEGTQQRADSSETQGQTIADMQPQITRKPLPISPRMRIKTLKKHQSISTETVRKKWWLHFQIPTSFTNEKHRIKGCPRDISVRKTVKEKSNISCSSSDALNLLADLALSDSYDHLPPQPDPTHVQKPETSLKNCYLAKDDTIAEQESVLHSLLRQPAAISTQPLESPSPSGLLGGSELVAVMSKEHAYSLPPSSSLLLDLLGTSFQVSPLSGSTKLLHHHPTAQEDGVRTLHHTVCQEDRRHYNIKAPEKDLKKHTACTRKLRRSRSFVAKDGSVQVTKQWKENYDFNLDSRFSSDSMSRTTIRALHGPWDFSTQDTDEEMQLILHMWIGLFYSRSTPRFFHFDLDHTNPCSEDSESFEMPCELVSVSGLRNPNADVITADAQGNQKEISVSGEQKEESYLCPTLLGPHKSSAIQCPKSVIQHTENAFTDGTNGPSIPLQKVEYMENPAIQEKTEGTAVTEQKLHNDPATGDELHERNDVTSDMKDSSVNSSSTEMHLVQKQVQKSYLCTMDNYTTVHCEIESTDVEKLHQDGSIELSPGVIHTSSDSTKKEPVMALSTNVLKNAMQLCRGESKVLSPEKNENLNEDEDSFVVDKDNVIKDDHFENKDEPQENNVFISNMETTSNLNHQQVLGLCDGPGSSNKECFTDSSHQAPLGEQLLQVNNREDTCLDLQFSTLPANNTTLAVKPNGIDEHSFSEKPLLIASRNDLVCHETAVEENSENFKSLEDLHDQCLPKFHTPDSLNNDVTEANRQVQLGEQLPQTNKREDDYLNGQLSMLSAKGDAFNLPLMVKMNVTDEQSFSKEALHVTSEKQPHTHEIDIEEKSESCISVTDLCEVYVGDIALIDENISETAPSDMEPVSGKPAIEESLESSHCLEDKGVFYHKVLIDTSGKNMGSLDCPSRSSCSVNDQDNKSVKGGKDGDGTDETELLKHQPHLPKFGDVTRVETELALNGTDLEYDKTNKDFKNLQSPVTIQFNGLNTSREDLVQPYDPLLEANIAEVKDQLSPFTETASGKILPTDVFSASQTEPTTEKRTLSLLNESKPSQPVVLGSESDEWHSTSAINEKPLQYTTCIGPSSCSSSFSESEARENRTRKCLSQSSSSINDELSLKEKTKSTDNNNTSTLNDIHTDRLESSNKLHTQKSQIKISNRIQAPDIKQSLYQTDKQKESFTWPSFGHHRRSFPYAQYLQAIKLNTNQVGHKTMLQCPVMAVKPSRCDEKKTGGLFEGRENSVIPPFSKKESTKPLKVASVSPSMPLEKHKNLMGQIASLKDEGGVAIEHSPSLLSNVSDTGLKSDQAKCSLLSPLQQHQEGDALKFNKTPLSTLPMQSSQLQKPSNLIDESQSFWKKSLIKKGKGREGNTMKMNIKMNQKACLGASNPVVDYRDDSLIDDSLLQGSPHSLTFTILNNSQERSESFLEYLSKRSIQDDPTQETMEQECLIFSEQMKQLLKQSKRGPLHQVDKRDNANLSHARPMTLHFSSLEEQDDLIDHLDVPSLVGQKIQVDMSYRKPLVDSVEAKKTLLLQKLSQCTGKTMEIAEVSGVATACSRLYTTMMNDVSAITKVPSRPELFTVDYSNPKTEPFCSLNSIMDKSCKMKCRFFIFGTSEETFFEETKEQLVAEGHTAMQPFEFLVDEENSSPLLIILRNVDIAEHLCEVPHLLELKRSHFVHFVGIDEPSDVVNLTHQEMLIRGGFIMFDKAALESLTLYNMKQMSEILHEQNRKGKWRWMMHYTDSRRQKESARLNVEAKEKMLFLNQCQEEGILEVMPYHECDLMSRDQPDYLTCLVHLQVQNVSARFPVLITDATDTSFGNKGILTMTFNSLLAHPQRETFPV